MKTTALFWGAGGRFVGNFKKKYAEFFLGGDFLGKSKKKVRENLGGKQIFRGQFLEKFQKRRF